MNYYSDLTSIKGVGPKTYESLKKCGIMNIMDLLLYFPRDYENFSLINCDTMNEKSGKIIIEGTFIRIEKDIKTKSGKILSTLIFTDNYGEFKCRWFNQPYMKNAFKVKHTYILMGKIEIYKGNKILINPLIVNNHVNNLHNSKNVKIVPKYTLKGKLTNNQIIKLISQVLKDAKISENLPKWIIDKYSFCTLDYAIRNIHNPCSYEDLNIAKKRLKFQELFSYCMKVIMLKDVVNKTQKGISFSVSRELWDIKDRIPFPLTNAQNKVIREILIDEKKDKPMNRLVQGDVGSGKTIVSFIAIFNVIKNGYQTVLMAPTEILANQHYSEMIKLFKDFNINIKLLTGSTSLKCKQEIKNNLKNGDIDIIIGTHALIQEDVEFKNLGLVVTDEQHRFGVMQRSRLFNKGQNVDILVMTATPIPRTLSLYLYGDLDVSIIDELPPGRIKIKTCYIKKSMRDKAYKFALNEVKKGRQVYIVCPLVEDNEELELTSVNYLYEELNSKFFHEINTCIIHGKMSPKQKDDIMEKFAAGEIKVLISTTVIEVGINVPNASLMIIENAERFGLSQLHQLRGRVGRGSNESFCILIADIKNDIIRKRMEIMQNSTDGFYIAEQDLKLRGGGELFGLKQHGDDGLILSDVIDDIELLKIASYEAHKLLKSKNEQDIEFKDEIMKKLEQTSKFICFN